MKRLMLLVALTACSKNKREAGTPPDPPPVPRADAAPAAAPPDAMTMAPDASATLPNRRFGRPQEFACTDKREPGNVRPGIQGACKKDADCKAGKNGRCKSMGGRVQVAQCTYDLCFHDADCKTGGPCECEQYSGNHCLAGNCKVDADCGAGGSCARSNHVGCGGGDPAYFCRTPKDTCVDYSDCEKPGRGAACVFLPDVGHWGCLDFPACPVG